MDGIKPKESFQRKHFGRIRCAGMLARTHYYALSFATGAARRHSVIARVHGSGDSAPSEGETARDMDVASDHFVGDRESSTQVFSRLAWCSEGNRDRSVAHRPRRGFGTSSTYYPNGKTE
jgi:hypothetical protein